MLPVMKLSLLLLVLRVPLRSVVLLVLSVLLVLLTLLVPEATAVAAMLALASGVEVVSGERSDDKLCEAFDLADGSWLE